MILAIFLSLHIDSVGTRRISYQCKLFGKPLTIACGGNMCGNVRCNMYVCIYIYIYIVVFIIVCAHIYTYMYIHANTLTVPLARKKLNVRSAFMTLVRGLSGFPSILSQRARSQVMLSFR
jgi:hypothetical protein